MAITCSWHRSQARSRCRIRTSGRPRVGGAPQSILVVDEFDVRERVTDVEGHVVSPVRADRRRQCRLEVGGPLVGAAAAWTRRALGLTTVDASDNHRGHCLVAVGDGSDKGGSVRVLSDVDLLEQQTGATQPTRSVNRYGHPGRV